VTRDVLIPRPETELVVERTLAAVDVFAAFGRTAGVIDVGTGSGCIAVTIAAERPAVRLTATDTSAAALRIAAANALKHLVDQRVAFVHGALTAQSRDVDIVVSNPPYVAGVDAPSLMRDVHDFEPAAALFAGDDGLEVLRDLVPDAFRALRPDGRVILEIGAGQFEDVRDLLATEGFANVVVHEDLAGIPRVVEARRPRASV
jgi:release factor glutamine methyltransferase